MAMAHAGFVFLSMPKAGSTALQRHFSRHAQILFRQPPGMKHMSAATFENVMAPWLERYGHPRSSYETVCLARHPVDRAMSWWRYRSRPEASAEKSTGDTTFAQFAEGLVTGEVPLGTGWNFVTSMDGRVLVDRIYRYEHLAEAAGWMAERLDIAPPELDPTNVSPTRETEVDPGVRAMLETHYADDVRLWESAL
ncbi:sulfotransferase family 2 domain-containing protein [Nocardioides sp.]|uniref:sulfotransferase family 2 domain-containing protein n=1 Tax=Nocardioides sp. TaxID=35761 RepID=UPI001A3152E3|nr:sulfotransferase family 2 domain-containing protein [Nocardioides sp.]MBJ7357426.1 sulfotransferase family 2 domain-containing protein [Nocardioides sp.]